MAEDSLISFPHLIKVLKEYGQTAEELYQMELLSAGRVASGALQDSVHFIISEGDRSFEVSLVLADYWKYVEGGSKGTHGRQYATYPAHLPPVNKIVEWIKIKPVLPRQSDLTRRDGSPHRHRDGSEWTLDEIYEKMGWRVAKGIEKFGVEPVPAMDNTVTLTYQSFKDKIAEALREDLLVVFRCEMRPILSNLGA